MRIVDLCLIRALRYIEKPRVIAASTVKITAQVPKNATSCTPVQAENILWVLGVDGLIVRAAASGRELWKVGQGEEQAARLHSAIELVPLGSEPIEGYGWKLVSDLLGQAFEKVDTLRVLHARDRRFETRARVARHLLHDAKQFFQRAQTLVQLLLEVNGRHRIHVPERNAPVGTGGSRQLVDGLGDGVRDLVAHLLLETLREDPSRLEERSIVCQMTQTPTRISTRGQRSQKA